MCKIQTATISKNNTISSTNIMVIKKRKFVSDENYNNIKFYICIENNGSDTEPGSIWCISVCVYL